jgi:PAS domain S-box-containing protein
MALEHGVVVLDRQTRIVACNPAAERLLGRRADELLGRRPTELDLRIVGRDGSPLALEGRPSSSALRSGEAQPMSSSGSRMPMASAGSR